MDSRIKRTATALAVASALALPAVASAGEVKTGTAEGLTIKGFVIASLYMQDNDFAFSNGQAAQWTTTDRSTDEWIFGGDVRNTRITLAFNGPDAAGMKFGGAIEADFFGGFNGAGAFSDEQQTPRLRLAYVDVIRGKTTFRIGQFWSPMFGNVPASPTHVAFPLGYGTGMPGWRFPGLFIYHDFGGSDTLKTKLSLAMMRGSWSGPGNNLNDGSAGEAGTPQFEARLDLTGKSWSAYLVGHYDSKDCDGANDSFPSACPGTSDDSLDGTAIEFGAKVKFGAFTLAGNIYNGTAIGQQFGHITQFGDISSTGGWVQGSFQFNPNWAAHLFYGLDDPEDDDVIATIPNPVLSASAPTTPVSTSPVAARLKNEQIAASVMYSNGPYVLGVEWLNSSLDGRGKTTSPGAEGPVTVVNPVANWDGNQLSFSVWYKF